ncbi:hypothetical protein LCGC14_1745210 [marine sediment metagenome]|uniref:Uncharacterized protein n=1 Tax=marine sediment metagenome TaxID=412755 RepID=A0A0F9HT53_9ZZZZ
MKIQLFLASVILGLLIGISAVESAGPSLANLQAEEVRAGSQTEIRLKQLSHL